MTLTCISTLVILFAGELTMVQSVTSRETLSDFVSFANRKFEQMELSLINKDDKIRILENHVKSQDIEIAKLTKEIHSMKDDHTREEQPRHSPKSPPLKHALQQLNYTYHYGLTAEPKVHRSLQSQQTIPGTRGFSSTSIAFHASLTSTRNFTAGSTIIYNHESLDTGNGYSTYDGLFIVPVKGIYVITWTTVPDFYDFIQTILIVNGSNRGTSFSDSDQIHDIHPSTAVVVTSLNAGDHVFIRVGNTKHGSVVNSHYHGQSMFSGWRLF